VKVELISERLLVIKYETDFEKDLLARFIHESDNPQVIVMGQDGEAAALGTGNPHFFQEKK
jgi:hypothetical protein